MPCIRSTLACAAALLMHNRASATLQYRAPPSCRKGTGAGMLQGHQDLECNNGSTSNIATWNSYMNRVYAVLSSGVWRISSYTALFCITLPSWQANAPESFVMSGCQPVGSLPDHSVTTTYQGFQDAFFTTSDQCYRLYSDVAPPSVSIGRALRELFWPCQWFADILIATSGGMHRAEGDIRPMNGLPIWHACAPLHGRLCHRSERRDRSSQAGPGRIFPRPTISWAVDIFNIACKHTRMDQLPYLSLPLSSCVGTACARVSRLCFPAVPASMRPCALR